MTEVNNKTTTRQQQQPPTTTAELQQHNGQNEKKMTEVKQQDNNSNHQQLQQNYNNSPMKETIARKFLAFEILRKKNLVPLGIFLKKKVSHNPNRVRMSGAKYWKKVEKLF